MTTEILVHNPGTLMTQATDVAGVCKAIVVRTAKTIQGRKFVPVEGWQSIAATYGCVASSKDVRWAGNGFAATGELKRISDGAIIATAEGFVGEDEPTWFGGKNQYGKELPRRADYAIRAMAQTRAISRVCRSAFAFVVVLMDAGLSTTPAEEMAHESDQPAGGQAPDSPPPPSGTPSGPVETRTETMTRLCKEAGLSMADCLKKCGAASAEELSEADWGSFCRLANKKIKAA